MLSTSGGLDPLDQCQPIFSAFHLRSSATREDVGAVKSVGNCTMRWLTSKYQPFLPRPSQTQLSSLCATWSLECAICWPGTCRQSPSWISVAAREGWGIISIPNSPTSTLHFFHLWLRHVHPDSSKLSMSNPLCLKFKTCVYICVCTIYDISCCTLYSHIRCNYGYMYLYCILILV